MIKAKLLAAAFCFAATATAAIAAPSTFRCDLNSGQAKGWVAPEVIIQYDTGTGAAKVLDGIIYQTNGSAIPAQLAQKGNQVVLVWTVLVEDSRGQDTHMRYTGRHVPETNRISVLAQPDGRFEGRFRATGRCQVTDRRYEGF
ncbi:MAG: hypothetical protein AAFY31_04745 [Pseudomonadota bacterium]